MLQIEHIDIAKIATSHLNHCKKRVLAKINAYRVRNWNSVKNYLINNIDRILAGKPNVLEKIINKLDSKYPNWNKKEELKSIFDYNHFSSNRGKWNAYRLAEKCGSVVLHIKILNMESHNENLLINK